MKLRDLNRQEFEQRQIEAKKYAAQKALKKAENQASRSLKVIDREKQKQEEKLLGN